VLFVLEMIGPRVMMGSDMPFLIGDEEPAKVVPAAGLKPNEVASVTGGLAQKLFRIGWAKVRPTRLVFPRLTTAWT
jgi:hypothetical protein